MPEQMLGMTLVTAQTGPEGRQGPEGSDRRRLDIRRELYLGIVIDRQTGKPVFMASPSGGMEIEEVAAKNPEAILKEYIQPGLGLQAFQARKLAFGLGLAPELINDAVQFMMALYAPSKTPTPRLPRSIRSSLPATTRSTRSMRR